MHVTRILAVRHGETAWNHDTRIQGHTDIDLNDTGRWQAARLATALADERLTAVYASDLQRAFNTGAAIARVQGLSVQAHSGLRERHFGALEGKTWAEIETQHPEEAKLWRSRVPEWSPPEGESLQVLQQRILHTLQALASRHIGEQIALVAHGGVLDILYRAATGLELQAPRSWLLKNAAINRLLWTPESLTLVGWGDVAHLEAPHDHARALLDEKTT
ncbi:MAG: histidine phosphatase family protein [Hydrogenophaga sp.]|uniref:histidine phosphatase family protein n=1 Tax=Hydrogenophaga sp. TaxID=1904254 RepID=UPI00271F0303|nr:histidine phosphatase family protein [Hydrogenophaga sp.]MDO9482043.1 histidine phosphatase family protein [Hydrogenophaga sp.]MDP2219596.1 histidine phosphatase family protein [Hydrogenophaga sp.]MDP3342951.1 histidine phosphatase family protein [Hydrogenophaga sp.]MDP3807231.1 histidine phosphatase family protein [Hydrogenophaga sp.]MDP3922674.1 histidine phosphatase family protein [Hydrogenophaga sp.]